jgi:hypothetical protein
MGLTSRGQWCTVIEPCGLLWTQVEHKVGFGSVLVVDTNIVLTGTLGEGPGRNERGSIRVHSLGNNAVESPCASDGSVIGRVSVADASLSLSLSLGRPISSR